LHEILRGDRLAVGPLGLFAQMEGINEAVGRNIPRFGDARHRVEIFWIVGDEAFEEGQRETKLWHAGDDLRVDVLRFGAVADVQDFFRRSVVSGGRVFVAAGEEQRGNGEEAERDWLEGCLQIHGIFLLSF
jgi:hypothetical protein